MGIVFRGIHIPLQCSQFFQTVNYFKTIATGQLHVKCRLRTFTTKVNDEFDIFSKLSDPPDSLSNQSNSKRKPSDRVIRIVDEILCLSLIEAADLCDLCQSRLMPQNHGSSFEGIQSVPGRVPFPHPGSFFPGYVDSKANGLVSNASDTNESSPQAASADSVVHDSDKKNESDKSTLNVRLQSYDTARKLMVVKEVRNLTGLGLRESKEFVESVPKLLKKGLPREEAEVLKKKIEDLGGVIVLE